MAEVIRGFDKRSVQVVVDNLTATIAMMRNLRQLQDDRSLAVAITEAETSRLWLKELMERAPETV